jgi:hypothetical protein
MICNTNDSLKIWDWVAENANPQDRAKSMGVFRLTNNKSRCQGQHTNENNRSIDVY